MSNHSHTHTGRVEENSLSDHEPSELQLLTKQLMRASQKNKELHDELATARQEIARSKGSVEKLTIYMKEQEKKLNDLQHLNYTSKKSKEQKWEIERQLEEQISKASGQQEELHKLQMALDEGKQQKEQLERVIQFLRERSEEVSLEAKQLKEDYHGALETIMQLREQQNFLETTVHEIKDQLNGVSGERSEAQEELQNVHKQLNSLKTTLQESQNFTEAQKFLIEENQQLKKQLEDHTQAWDQTQHEIQTIRQTLLRTLKDSKKLEIQFQEVLNERISLANRAAQLQNLLDLQIDQTRLSQEQLVESQQRQTRSNVEHEQQLQTLQQTQRDIVENLTLQISELEERASQLSSKYQETELDLLQDREQAISHLTSEYEKAIGAINAELQATKKEFNEIREDYHQSTQLREDLKMEIQHLSHQLNTSQSDANEKENELRISQQHLAKKVKEVTILQDKIDMQQQRSEELSRSLAAAEQKSIDLEKVIYDEQNRSKSFHEQLSESVKNSEQKAAKLEEKYMDLHQKWAATEARNRELEKLAERHLQMQSQMQQFFGGFSPLPQQAKLHAAMDSLPTSFSDSLANSFSEPKAEVVEKEGPIPFQNLLQPIKGNGRIKSNLFD